VSRITPIYLLDIVVGEERKRIKKINSTKKNLLDDFKNSDPGDGDVADDDRAPNDSSSGSGGEEDKPGVEDPKDDEGLYASTIPGANDPGEENAEGNAETEEQENGADGDDKESSLVKGGLKNDEDYNSDTNVKNGDNDNAPESKEEAEIKGDQDEDGVDELEEVTPISPANLKQPPATEGHEIVDIAESPQLGPVLERSVIGKDGKKVMCIATLPGREYFSDDIEDAIFDDAKCEPPYVDWTVGGKRRKRRATTPARRPCELRDWALTPGQLISNVPAEAQGPLPKYSSGVGTRGMSSRWQIRSCA
jgi:hypothetical protein